MLNPTKADLQTMCSAVGPQKAMLKKPCSVYFLTLLTPPPPHLTPQTMAFDLQNICGHHAVENVVC